MKITKIENYMNKSKLLYCTGSRQFNRILIYKEFETEISISCWQVPTKGKLYQGHPVSRTYTFRPYNTTSNILTKLTRHLENQFRIKVIHFNSKGALKL